MSLNFCITLVFLCSAVVSCRKSDVGDGKPRVTSPDKPESQQIAIGQKQSDISIDDPLVSDAVRCLRALSTADNALNQTNAIRTLSEHPSPEIISLLVRKARFVSDPHHFKSDGYFPAYGALVEIGNAAVNPMTSRFENTTDDIEQLSLLNALIEIKGKHWVIQYLSALETARKRSHATDSYEKWAKYVAAVH